MGSKAFDKMTKAKTHLVQYHVFFASIALRADYIETEQYPTMATDMRRIFYNPEFVGFMTILETAAVIAHEVLHIAFLHGMRRGHRDPLIWNLACDFAINLIVLEMGLKLPNFTVKDGKRVDLPPNKPNYCYDKKYAGWSAYEIYEDLIKDAKQFEITFSLDGEKGEDGEGKTVIWGQILDAKDENGKSLGEAQQRELEEQIKEMVQQAAESAKKAGKLPGGLEGLIEAVGKPKIDWQAYIQRWVRGHIPDDYTWVRPNRRMLGLYGLFTPSLECHGSGTGVLSVDASGSVSDDELREYVREIAGVISMCSPEKLYIIVHDAIVQSVTVWEQGETFDSLKITGRGGTNIRPSFETAAKLEEKIDWMICFTDMGICDYPTPAEAPDYPVLWAATGPDNAPFGTYIPIRDAL